MPRPLCTTLLGLALLAPLAPLACDDKPPALAPDAPKAAVPEPANVAPKVPIAEQPRKPLSLVAIPFTVDVPPGWKVASHDLPSRSVTMLEGPLEGDEVRISLAAREEVSGEILKQLIEKAKREAADDRSIELSVRPTGGLQAVSRRRVVPAGATQPSTQPSADGALPNTVDWRVSLYLPSGVRHQQFEMRFIGLTADTYQRNKALLDAVINSIKPTDKDAF